MAKASFDAVVVKPAGTPGAARSAAAGPVTPLEILDKPRPTYSEEARRLQIEGEVVLEALFSASGRIRVTRVVHSLGHGLDENAIQAAAGIRFRPATDNGSPRDMLAVVRVAFQLAY
jgi:TonB family protein